MMVEVSDLSGNKAFINSETLIRIRPSFGDYEPPETALIDFVSDRIFTGMTLGEVSARFSPFARLAKLRSPADTPVLLNADAIAAVKAPNPILHHPNARSGEQQLHETETEAAAILAAASRTA